MSSAPNSSSPVYSPTPMEEAFALYILQQAFPSSYQLYQQQQQQQGQTNANTNTNKPIHIPGQEAVAFLTTSGIHRLILRNIWTVADPQNEGTLLDITQLHTILRLVALAQAPGNQVERELLAVGSMPPPKPTPTEVLLGMLQQSAGQVCPLPHFERIPTPNQTKLQQIYQQQILGQQNNYDNSLLGSVVADMSQTRANDNNAAATQQPEQQSTSSSPPPPSSFIQPPQPQGMAAFDDLVAGIQDQPLPSLAPPQSERGMMNTGTGSGSANDSMSPQPPPPPPSDEIQSSMSFPGVGTGTTASARNNKEEEDEFGGFATSTGPPGPTPQTEGMGALDAFVGTVSDAPLPALGTFGGSQQQSQSQQPQQPAVAAEEDDDEFGGFSDASAASASAPAAEGMAAMDAFGAVSDAPLPALGSFGTQQQPQSQPQPQLQEKVATMEDEFGGFSDASAASAPTQEDAFGGFPGTASAPTIEPMGFSALDALGPAGNAPLPALDSFGSQQSQSQSQPPSQPENKEDEDEFGGFSDAPASKPESAAKEDAFGGFSSSATPAPAPESSGLGALDALGSVSNAPLPALGSFGSQQSQDQLTTSKDVDAGDFGEFSIASPTPAPDPAINDDNYGGFSDATPVPAQDEDEFAGFAASVPSSAPEPSGFDALDALGSVSNAPLPALESFGSQPQQTQPSQKEQTDIQGTGDGDVEEDDFGDFSNAAAPVPSPANLNDNDEEDFGGFSDAVSQPQTEMAQDDFGNGGGGLSTREQTKESSGFDALDALGPADNAPLSALGSFGQSQASAEQAPSKDMVDDDDDFGGFADASPAPAPMEAGFGGFEEAKKEQQQNQENEDLVGFAQPSAQPTHEGDDPFGAFAGVQDAPLPSLGMRQPQSDRGFGGSSSPIPQPSIQPSLSFPGTGAVASQDNDAGDVFGAFDALGGSQDTPLPSEPYSGDNLGCSSDAPKSHSMDDSFGSFTASVPETQTGRYLRRLSSGSSHKRKVGTETFATEILPKDLKPHLPGEHYGRTPSMRKLPESDLDDQSDAEEDPFAELEPAPDKTIPKPVELHEPMSLGPGAETLPKDLTPHAPGQRYVPHSPNAQATPGGLETLPEPAAEETDEDEFGGFERAVSQYKPTTKDIFNEAMPHELQPHPPGKHYVPHSPRAEKTPGGLETVGEMPAAPFDSTSKEWNSDLSHLNPPGGLTRQETPMPSDLHPHKLGQHYVPHSPKDGKTPGGLTTVGESFEDFTQNAPFGADDGFGEFSAGSAAPPPQLSRQATPVAQDLQPQKFQMSAPSTATVHEDDEDDFGNFADATGGNSHVPPPSKLSRQATPAPGDIASTEKTSLDSAFQGNAIQEGEEENEDDFGAFAESSAPSPEVPAPSQMKREATPMPQNLRPDISDNKVSSQSGLGTIGEVLDDSDKHSAQLYFGKQHKSKKQKQLSLIGDSDEETDTMAAAKAAAAEDENFGDFEGFDAPSVPPPAQFSRQSTPAPQDMLPPSKKASSGVTIGATAAIPEGDNDRSESDTSKSDDPFSAFDTLAPPQGDLPPLPSFGSTENTDDASEKDSVAAPTQLSPRVTPDDPGLDPFTRKQTNTSRIGGQKLPTASEAQEEDIQFGSFADSGYQSAIPAASKLDRQPTPTAKDIELIKRKAAVPQAATIYEEEAEDAFSGFADASAGKEPLPQPAQLTRQATPAPGEMEQAREKLASAVTFGENTIEEGEEENDFGNFGGFEQGQMPGQMAIPAPTQMKREATPIPQELRPDLKGGNREPEQQSRLGSIGEEADAIPQGYGEDADLDFGDFGSFEQAQQELQQSASGEAFGTVTAPAVPPASSNDSFGDFAEFSSAPITAKNESVDKPAESANDDSFGDFAAFTPAPAPMPMPGPTTPPAPQSSNDESFGDFAAFEEAPSGGSETSKIEEDIILLSKKLPKTFLGSLDMGQLFRGMLANEPSLSNEKHKRAQRSIQVLSLLSSSHSELASNYWNQVIRIVRDEISLGNTLLEEASSLSSQEKQMAKKHLDVFVAGLGEYVRATRSIAASITDVLLLDVSSPLKASGAESSVPLLKQVLEVEMLWEGVQKKADFLGLQKPNALESIEEIRTKCLNLSPSTDLCHLSLQPLSQADKQTTKAAVEWAGKHFMACSANFLANKCPFYVVN